jgi:hypothetical protein
MTTQGAPTYEEILTIVASWPEERRHALVRDVWKTLEAPPDAARRRAALRRLRGILATDDPPPSDEEIRRWLDERRWQKYG